jgi:hypothetical protein
MRIRGKHQAKPWITAGGAAVFDVASRAQADEVEPIYL